MSRSRAPRVRRAVWRLATCCAAARLAACCSRRSMLNSSARRISSLSQGEACELHPRARRTNDINLVGLSSRRHLSYGTRVSRGRHSGSYPQSEARFETLRHRTNTDDIAHACWRAVCLSPNIRPEPLRVYLSGELVQRMKTRAVDTTGNKRTTLANGRRSSKFHRDRCVVAPEPPQERNHRDGVRLCRRPLGKQPVVLLLDYRITFTAAVLQPVAVEH